MLSKDEIDEINLLAQFSLDSDHAGLKVHSHEADPALVAAAAAGMAKRVSRKMPAPHRSSPTLVTLR